MGFNPFDPAGIFGGSDPISQLSGGGGSSSTGGTNVAVLGGGAPDPSKDDEKPLDVQKAYGFGQPGTASSEDSQFNAMRKSQLGMGRQST